MFKPLYSISLDLASDLMRIEALRQEIDGLPITPKMLDSLRKTARLQATHYSTMIEGNRLTQHQVQEVVLQSIKIPDRERDEKEVLGYYVALEWVLQGAQKKQLLTEDMIKQLHALVMGGGSEKVQPAPYRDGQNVIKDSKSGAIVYLPPEAHDVAHLMHDFSVWIEQSKEHGIPAPIRAAIAHYQFATIHPYWDGNGRVARLLATLILHRNGYGLKGIYSLDEYYAIDLGAYYDALTIGPHNDYLGRADADITSWIAYFCKGMVYSFERIKEQALRAHQSGQKDQAIFLRKLDIRQRMVMSLFAQKDEISTQEVAHILGLQPRTARVLMQKWVTIKFLEIAQKSKKSRTYILGDRYRSSH
ncbi:MAG: Fic family protein [Candidatus Babeliales bacterium]